MSRVIEKKLLTFYQQSVNHVINSFPDFVNTKCSDDFSLRLYKVEIIQSLL